MNLTHVTDALIKFYFIIYFKGEGHKNIKIKVNVKYFLLKELNNHFHKLSC